MCILLKIVSPLPDLYVAIDSRVILSEALKSNFTGFKELFLSPKALVKFSGLLSNDLSFLVPSDTKTELSFAKV
ncbi:MAG: hypothetical protein CM15mV125_340 [uncultured marine virus]|nr:MAG: hypothetical protein CM15mV125_340 [uncultured marine virus]